MTQTKIPFSDFSLEQWLTLIDNAKVIAFDTETTGLSVYDSTDTILGFSIGINTEYGVLSEYFPIAHVLGNNLDEAHWKQILDAVVRKPLIMHNAIFDLTVLRNLGYTDITQFFDTMKLDHLIDENWNTYNLDSTTERWLGYPGKNKTPQFQAGMLAYGWAGMPSHLMYDYAKTDGKLPIETIGVMQKHKEMTPALKKYWKDIEAPTLNVLARMRQRGVRINLDICREEAAKGKVIMKNIADELGGNPGSSIMMKKIFWEQLGLPIIINKKTKKPTFDKDAMKRYEDMLSNREGSNELAARILEYRGWGKAVSGYYLPYQKFVSRDGRLRAEYKPTGTVTGRFSCADPNLQQIPKETDKPWNGKVKSALIAEAGFKLWELDYAQLEFRLAASAAHEQKLVDIFNDPDRDIFDEMSLDLGMARQATKTLNYTIQYGGGKTRIKDVFGTTEEEAEDIIANYYEKYPNLKKAGQWYGRQVKRNGYVDIWSGRRRHFRYPQDEYYKAFNSFIQGGAADLVKLAMVESYKEVDSDEECRLLLQVHDSLVWEIRDGREEYFLPKIAKVMTRHSDDFGVRLAVDAHPWFKG